MMNWSKHCLNLGFAALLFTGAQSASAQTAEVCFDQKCFQPEIARSFAEREHGLMGRKSLDERQGMLFIYDTDNKPQFWMKGMKMALDFVWLDAGGKVVALHQQVPPCKTKDCQILASDQPVRYVLEIAPGTVQRTGIQIGDKASISGTA